MIADQTTRSEVLDCSRSFLVQAPAGSGKTSLLIQRFLALLARVERPEQVLAMTFTRKAAGEMRERIIQALQSAAGAPPAEPHALVTHQLGLAVLQRDAQLGWRLLDNPGRLNVMTIDSFCSTITRAMPLLAQFGAQPEITDDAAPLYAQAAQAALALAADDPDLQKALYVLLLQVDGRRDALEQVIAVMLARREQWQDWVVAGAARTADLRLLLEAGLSAAVERALAPLRQRLDERLLDTLAQVAACSREQLLARDKACPWEAVCTAGPHALAYWQAAAELLLTTQGTWRKQIGDSMGLPAKSSGQLALKALIAGLADDPALAERLHACRSLPPPQLAESTWEVLEAMLQILRLALGQLWIVFQQARQIDYTGVALAAVQALGTAEEPSERLLALDARIRHLLVDEFQDTSILQGNLLGLLTAGWQPGDGRTLFAVGDPMQSIYRFRKAELNLFLQAWENGRIKDVPVTTLNLAVNFRSECSLVDWYNAVFREAFPDAHDLERGAAAHFESDAHRGDSHDAHVTLHYWSAPDPVDEARVVASEVQAALAESAGKVAILVASRSHAQPIMAALRDVGVPYRAQDMDPLLSRPVVGDLLALTRALLHPADRLHVLAVLRSPMVGLSLADLLALTEHESLETEQGRPPAVIERLLEDAGPLSADGQLCLQRFLPVWRAALARLGRSPVERLVRSLWLSLGGPLCTDATGWQDAERFFAQLARLEGEQRLTLENLDQALERLYAAANADPALRVEIMTMHKAKGLQFDTVILPQLSRKRGQDDLPLLLLEEMLDGSILIAPRPARGRSHEDDRFYQWLLRRERQRLHEERKRLFYVAVTRAERKLVLCGVAADKNGVPEPQGELFKYVWCDALPMQRIGHAADGGAMAGAVQPQRVRPDWQRPPLPETLPVSWKRAVGEED